MKNEIKIKKLTNSDIEKATELYLEVFKNNKTAQLGKEFVKQMIKWFSEEENRLSLVAKKNKEIVGFVLCSAPGAETKIFKKSYKAIIVGLIKNPLLAKKFGARKIISVLQKITTGFLKKNKKKKKKRKIVGIASIAVKKELQGEGIGSKLIAAVKKMAKKKKFKSITVATEPNNKTAIKFYEKKEFKIKEISKKKVGFEKTIK